MANSTVNDRDILNASMTIFKECAGIFRGLLRVASNDGADASALNARIKASEKKFADMAQQYNKR